VSRPVARLRGALLTLAGFLRQHRAVVGRLALDAAQGEPVVLEFLRANAPRHLGLLLALLHEAQAAGELQPLPPLQAFTFLMGAVNAPTLIATGAQQLGLAPALLGPALAEQVLGEAALVQRVDLALNALGRPIPAECPHEAHPLPVRAASSPARPAAAGGWLAGCQPSAPAAWSGYVEGDYVYVAAPVAGTLTHLAVAAGQTVAASAPLFQLDDVSARAARAQAEAQVAAAQAQASNGQTGLRRRSWRSAAPSWPRPAPPPPWPTPSCCASAAWWPRASSRSRSWTTPTAARQAHDKVAELEAALQTAEQPTARPAELAAAQANTRAAQEAQAQAAWREQQARQSAPAAGLVADTFFREGEYVGAGQPVVSLLPPDHRKARFYVPEAEVGRLQVGQPVSLGCDGCGAPIAARISRIAPQAEYTPPVIYSNSQRSKLVWWRPCPAPPMP
jgi:HlyD family secretion protein